MLIESTAGSVEVKSESNGTDKPGEQYLRSVLNLITIIVSSSSYCLFDN